MSYSLDYLLPEELIEDVLSYLPRSCHRSMCLVSKKINRLATAWLYERVTLSKDVVPWSYAIGVEHILPFAYLMWKSPPHASLVRSLAVCEASGGFGDESAELKLGKGRYWPGKKRPWPSNADLEVVLREACRRYVADDDETDDLYRKIRLGTNEDAVIALLLPSLPNLQVLDLGFDVIDPRPSLIAMLTRLGRREHPFDNLSMGPAMTDSTDEAPFSSLSEVMISGKRDTLYGDPDPLSCPVHFGACFHLPGLRSIYGYLLKDHGRDKVMEPIASIKPRSCPVEYIELRASRVHHGDLDHLMKACIPGKLRTVIYEISYKDDMFIPSRPQLTIDALEPHWGTLEALGLSYPRAQWYDEHEVPQPITFHSFRALKRLKLVPLHVWGYGVRNPTSLAGRRAEDWLWRALPDTIEEIWITRAEWRHLPRFLGEAGFVPKILIPALWRLLQNHHEAVPKLRRIRFEFELREWKMEWVTSLGSFVDAAESNGIGVTLILDGLKRKLCCGAYLRGETFPAEEGQICPCDKALRGWPGCVGQQRLWGWNEDVEWREWYDDARNDSESCRKYWLGGHETQDITATLKKIKARESKGANIY